MSIDLDFGTLNLDTANNVSIDNISLKEKKIAKAYAIAKADHAIEETARRSVVKIAVSGDVAGTSYANLLTNIDTLKAGLQDGKQKFTLDTDRYIMAQMVSFEYKYKKLETFATWKATFDAPYGFWLSESATVDSRVPTSGTAYAITNNGNAPARCKIIFTAPAGGIADNLVFENITTGEGMSFRGTIVAAKDLEIDNRYDTDDFEVLNDGADDHTNFEGDFITLNPGVNSVEFTGEASTDVAITFRDTYY